MTTYKHWIRQGQYTAIALIHGIGAEDPVAYWQEYLDVLLADPDLTHCGLFVWEYPTHVKPGKLTNLMSDIGVWQRFLRFGAILKIYRYLFRVLSLYPLIVASVYNR